MNGATVKDLKAFLETVPDDLPVMVLREDYHGWSAYTEWTKLDLSEYSANMDKQDDPAYPNSYGLYLGEH